MRDRDQAHSLTLTRLVTRRFLFILLLLATPTLAAPRPLRVALTFDDLPDLMYDDHNDAQIAALMNGIIGHLTREHIPAIGFVNEDKLLDEAGNLDPARVALLDHWLDAGLQLGNHTYSHEGVSDVGVAEYENDILKGERVIRSLSEKHGQTLTWFRHPYLDTGKTVEERETVDRFLADHAYRIAPVTIDDSEWIFAMAYGHTHNPITRWRIGSAYLRYMELRFAWYEARSRTVFHREIPQILLLHADELNAALLPKLIEMIRRRGYAFISIDDAMRDPSYESRDAWTSDAGVSWIERWGVTRGIPESVFDGDPQTPKWIQKLAGVKEQ